MEKYRLQAISFLPILILLTSPAFAQTSSVAASSSCKMEAAEKVFTKCKACHTLDDSGTHLAGPNLHRVINRPAASVEGYQFSRAMRKSHLVWDKGTLHTFLKSPQTLVPKTKMAFSGLKKESDREAVICYLASQSK